jgi:hypothetical protein
MTQGDNPMWEDPHESSALRQLLRAGHVENSDYDVERGLARHLAQLQGGAPMPAWAVQSTLQKSASWSVLAWLLPPLISAGVVGAWLALRPADPTPASLVALTSKPSAAAAPSSVTLPTKLAAASAATQPANNIAAADVKLVERDAHDDVDRDQHNLVARNARPATRATSSRRARGSRADDGATTYGAAAQANRDGSGSGAGVASGTNAAASTKSAADDAVSNKAAAKAAVSPSAQEPVAAPAEEAKAQKPQAERRAKEEESAKLDEVTGARLEREMRMLAVAQRVLTEDPARSLRLCRQGESEFRGSMFSAERKQVALLALVQLGNVEQARREGIPFLRAFPNAPWSARLREALSTGKLPNP